MTQVHTSNPGLSQVSSQKKAEGTSNKHLARHGRQNVQEVQILGFTLRHPTPPGRLEVLTRPQLQRFLAIRTGHGDFAWYHRRYKHDEAELRCGCGRPKTPDHLVMCRQSRRSFGKWPWPGEGPRIRPQTRAEKKEYLRFLMGDPLAFKEFLEVTRFYANICPRGLAPLSLPVSPMCLSFLFSLSHVEWRDLVIYFHILL